MQDAGSGDLVGVVQNELVGPLDAAGSDLCEEGRHDGELDGGGGAHALVFTDAVGLAGVEILGVEGHGALEGSDGVVDARVEGRCEGG